MVPYFCMICTSTKRELTSASVFASIGSDPYVIILRLRRSLSRALSVRHIRRRKLGEVGNTSTRAFSINWQTSSGRRLRVVTSEPPLDSV